MTDLVHPLPEEVLDRAEKPFEAINASLDPASKPKPSRSRSRKA